MYNDVDDDDDDDEEEVYEIGVLHTINYKKTWTHRLFEQIREQANKLNEIEWNGKKLKSSFNVVFCFVLVLVLSVVLCSSPS